MQPDQSAFPIPLDDRPGAYPAEPGMSLRDYFAAKAMQSVLLKWPPVLTDDKDTIRRDTEEVARGAYAMADAMMRSRNVDLST